MKLRTTENWNEMLLRVLQSWADTAILFAPLEDEEDRCYREQACTRDTLVHAAEAADQTVDEWPHWMRCELSNLLLDLKLAIQDQARKRPHYSATVERYFIGSGNIHSRDRTPEVAEAIAIMDLNTKLFYIWIQNELMDLGKWPRKVYDRLRIPETPDAGRELV